MCGNFNQIILETHDGHLSVCVELDRDPVQVAVQVADRKGMDPPPASIVR
jgi:hypothetical protein